MLTLTTCLPALNQHKLALMTMNKPIPLFLDREIELVLFDLDGTLADTASDLAYALNQTLAKHQQPELSFETIRPHVSNGSIALVQIGFNIDIEHPEFNQYRQDILDIYLANVCRETTLFPEMDTVIKTLESNNITWGIVTNKPAYLTDPLMEQMNLSSRAACIISGDTTAHSKPHPEPIFHACRAVGIAPEKCLYVGDAERDIEAGRRAGTATLTALFGYIADHDTPEHWGADKMIKTPIELLHLLGINASHSN